MRKNPLGEQFSPILTEIHNALWDHEVYLPGMKMGWVKKDLKSSMKIFMTVFLEHTVNYFDKKKMTQKQAELFIVEAGHELRDLVKKYTGIDTHLLYKEDL